MMGFDLLLIAAVIAYALGWRPQFNQTGQNPLEILKARYVRGEITRGQYEALKADIR